MDTEKPAAKSNCDELNFERSLEELEAIVHDLEEGQLGLADALKDGPLSVSELAKAAGANADALNRVLRALASVGVFRETPNGRFDQTALSACMRSDVPGSMRAWARVNRAGWQWQMLGNLLYSVRTGNASSSGAQLWEHFARNKEDGDIFNAAMTSFSAGEIAAVLASYDFSSIRKLVDVGGGYGSLLASILKANSEMRGVLFDAPPVIEGATREIEAWPTGANSSPAISSRPRRPAAMRT